MAIIAHVVNHPHFAHSYQLFYSNFKKRAFGNALPPKLRARYLFAGVLAPSLLLAYFTYCVLTKNANLLGLSANLMFFLVGWHYVKQGYGMLMVDAVLKRNFFDDKGKIKLQANAYSVWMTSWLLINRALGEHNYWGLDYIAIKIPDALFVVSICVTVGTSIAVLPVLAARLKGSSRLTAGAVAYVSSLYLWLLTSNPALWLVIPAFHSIQYLVVVWRYRLNQEKLHDPASRRFFRSRPTWVSLASFAVTGLVLGYIGFWHVPSWLDAHTGIDQSLFGGALFMFLCWIFINIHHYLLDNVMWRKDNPDTKRYLFGDS